MAPGEHLLRRPSSPVLRVSGPADELEPVFVCHLFGRQCDEAPGVLQYRTDGPSAMIPASTSASISLCHRVVADMLAAMNGDVMPTLPNAGYEGRVTCSRGATTKNVARAPALARGSRRGRVRRRRSGRQGPAIGVHHSSFCPRLAGLWGRSLVRLPAGGGARCLAPRVVLPRRDRGRPSFRRGRPGSWGTPSPHGCSARP
jgi:hypothetical protein